jgi:hypothetical protein
LKVPDTSVAVAKGGLSLEECEKECLRNCSCTAYVVANVSNGGSGCLAWHGDLMDIQKLTDQGQDLFLRVDKVELGTDRIGPHEQLVNNTVRGPKEWMVYSRRGRKVTSG